MSSTSALGSSSSATYAVQLAQTSALQRSLYNLDTAVQSGNLSSAGSNLAAIMKAYPQYAPSASDSSSSQDPVNQGFQALADAIGKNDAAGAKTAWTKIKSELTKEGLPALKNPTDNTALVLAQNKESMDQSVLSSLFGTSSSTTPSVDSLLGGASSSSTDDSNSIGSMISSWIAYQANGTTTSPVPASGTGSHLNASA